MSETSATMPTPWILATIGALGVLGAPTRARADDTFEAKAAGGDKLVHQGDLVWAVTAPCDQGDDVLQRQCKKLRDGRLAALASKPMLLELGELDVGPWSSAKKSAEVTISGCIACGGANGTHVIAGAAVAAGGKPTPAPIMMRVMLFDTDAARAAFATSVKGTRTQLVVALPAKAGFDVAGVRGTRVDVLAYRVFTPCDGKIVLAEPASSPVAAEPKACAK